MSPRLTGERSRSVAAPLLVSVAIFVVLTAALVALLWRSDPLGPDPESAAQHDVAGPDAVAETGPGPRQVGDDGVDRVEIRPPSDLERRWRWQRDLARSSEITEPTRVVIPAIGVDAPLVPVGLLPDGAMETPAFGWAGWYDLGPRPGAVGPAVIAAHVDSRRGPDVFFHLGRLSAGDEITVVGAAGERVAFVVERREQHAKEELPAAAIWGPTDVPALRLITCGGTFDRDRRSYRDNVVVYATIAPPG